MPRLSTALTLLSLAAAVTSVLPDNHPHRRPDSAPPVHAADVRKQWLAALDRAMERYVRVSQGYVTVSDPVLDRALTRKREDVWAECDPDLGVALVVGGTPVYIVGPLAGRPGLALGGLDAKGEMDRIERRQLLAELCARLTRRLAP